MSRLQRPGLAQIVCVVAALCCILLPQWWSLNRHRAQRADELRSALNTTVATTVEAIEQWETRRVDLTRALAQAPEINTLATRLLDQSTTQAERPDLEARFTAAVQRFWPPSGPRSDSFALIRLDGQCVYGCADTQGCLASVAAQTSQSEPPFVAPCGFSEQHRANWPVSIAALIADAGDKGIGLLALRFDALPELRDIVEPRKLGYSGRTLVYSEQAGWLAQSDGESSDCRSGPAEVLKAARLGLPSDRADSGLNLNGYPNCRGDQAVGAWTWNPELGLGVLTELSHEEAFGSLETTGLTIVALGLLLGAGLLLVVMVQTSDAAGDERHSGPPSKNTAAWAVLAVSLITTAAAYLSASSRFDSYQQERFLAEAENTYSELVNNLQREFDTFSTVASAGDQLPIGQVAEWRRYLEALKLGEEHRSLTCFAVVSVRQGDAAESFRRALAQQCRGNEDSKVGFCSFCPDPPAAGRLLRAAQSVRDVSHSATTVVREGDPKTAKLVLLRPLDGAPGDGLVSSRWSVVVLDVPILMEQVERLAGSRLSFELFLGDPAKSGELVYDSDASSGPRLDDEIFIAHRRFELAGPEFSVLLSGHMPASPPITENYPAQVLLAGLAISVLLFDVALVLSSTRARAITIAEVMSQRYRESESRIRAMVDNAPDGIISFNNCGIVSTFNPGAERLFGYSKHEVSELRITDLLAICSPPEVERLAALESGVCSECMGVRKSGPSFPAELTVSRSTDSGQVTYTAIVRDVSARRETEERLRDSEERYALAARGANDGLWDWNLKTNQVYYSPRWKAMIGAAEGQIGTSPEDWLDRVHADHAIALRRKLADHLEGRAPHFEAEYRMRHAGGGYRWVLTRGIAVRGPDGEATRIAGSQSDITVRKRAEQQLLYDALHDPLTRLPNRAFFMSRLERACTRSAHSPQSLFGVLFLDIDRFKIVNDSLGHSAGDQLLIAIGERLKRCVRPGDTICRLGGDEFAVLVENLSGVADATRIAGRIQQTLEEALVVSDREIYSGVSIGIALSSSPHQPAEDLLRDADIAMYRAKSRGRAHYELFNKTMHTSAIEKLQLETDLRHAIDRGDLLLLYQPIVSLTNGGLPACEALIRWRHPTRGMILPEQFIEVAEDSGLINPITRWVLRTACNQQLAWREAGLSTIRISVNISPQQLIRQEVRSLVNEALEESGIEPSALQIELTESAFMECSEPTLGPLRDLFERGVQVALDDFGTGYSSLVYLRRIPLNFIKIDQNFIRAIPESADDAAITSGLIALAHSLHLKVIAEGVETPEQLAFLAAQGCDAAQGFAISRPVSADEFEALIRTGIDFSTLLEEAALSAD